MEIYSRCLVLTELHTHRENNCSCDFVYCYVNIFAIKCAKVCTSQGRILCPLFNLIPANLLTQPVDFITPLLRMVRILPEVVPYPGDHEQAQLGLAKGGYS